MDRWIACARSLSRTLVMVFDWLAERLEDAAKWAANLVRYLPNRVYRFCSTVVVWVVGLVTFVPVGLQVWRRGGRKHFVAWLRARSREGAIRIVQLWLEALDIIGIPELYAFLWRQLTRATPLTGAEIAAAAEVLGSQAMRYHDIRVAQGGILRLVFARNGDRAFASFHTVNLPSRGGHRRENMDVLLHELVHVLQYERAGSRYFAEALLAQHEEGYGYGGPEGLRRAWSEGTHFRHFNREQQAQLVQDYYVQLRNGWDATPYEPYIAELRQGWL